jgi:5-methylcytosine-specific restriction enzyme B
MAGPPSRETLAQAVATWDRAAVAVRVANAQSLREAFVKAFPIGSWETMELERYALGQPNSDETACWWLEFKTRDVGSMSGGSSAKHIIYYSKKDGDWRYPKQYNSPEQAWNAVRSGFVEILGLAGQGRFEETDDVAALAGAVALRSKTLFMYFGDDLLPISSKAHLNHFLRVLGEPAKNWSAVCANRHLLQILRSEPLLEGLSAQELGYFLYYWADPQTTVRVVKIAPGEQARHWQECLDGGFICIGWDEVGDLSEYDSKEAFRDAFREQYPYNSNEAQVARKSNELWTLMELQPGDKIVANRGIREVLAVGTVNETGYGWHPERSEYRHTLGVDWDVSHAKQIEPVKRWATTTVAKVPAELYKSILDTQTPPQPVAVDRVYLEIEEALERRRQVILYGPPGTGKTYTARRAATWLLAGGSDNPDASHMLSDEGDLAANEQHFAQAGTAKGNVWFMVADPGHWRWSQLVTDGTVDYSLGRLKRNFPLVRAGDLVIGYESTPTKRVVAIARVTGEYDSDNSPEMALTLETVAAVANGLTWSELSEDRILSESEPVRFRCQGTLFALSSVQADRLLARLTDRDSSLASMRLPGYQRLTQVTFHPSYTYEDFVEGFRPVPTSQGQLDLRITDGVFKEACARASADPDRRHVMIIDEINRGNIPKVFGELITLLEKDKRGMTVQLPQSKTEFAIPDNLVIIGTMNTADRSIHLLDTALRRRFAFIELMPEPELLEGITVGSLSLEDFLVNLNEQVRDKVGREKQIGHAVFYDGDDIVATPESFASIFKHELLPMLQEYLFEDYALLADVLGEKVIDTQIQRPSSLIHDPEALCAALADHLDASAKS